MELSEAIRGRRSVRLYRSTPIPQEQVMQILELANWAPSKHNRQHWAFIVVTGRRVRELAEVFGRVMEELLPHYRLSPHQEAYFRNFAQTFGHAPMLIGVTGLREEDESLRDQMVQSVSAAMQNLCLAAHAQGLATCWISGHFCRESLEAAEILGIPKEQELIALTPLGIPAELPPPPPREDPALMTKVVWLSD